MSIFKKTVVVLGVICGVATGMQGHKVVPDAPIVNFKLPMFGKKGYKIWDLTGQEGRYLSEEEVAVSGMVLRTYSGDEGIRLESTIESLEAMLLPKANRAYGNEMILMRGPEYSVLGKGWQWDGNMKKVVVKENVRVTFEESLDNVLIP